jgi:probable lipoprotein (TIGR04455 family)
MRVALPLLLAACAACSSIETAWVRAGYDANATAAVKHIAVVAWAPPEYPELANVLANVAADRVKLKLNYLVHSAAPAARGWSEACGELEGVLAIQALNVAKHEGGMELAIAAELYSCKTGALIWRAQAHDTADATDSDLVELVQSYVRQLGDAAAPYATAAFLVLRDILDTLPNPTLTDDEVMEKIELG